MAGLADDLSEKRFFRLTDGGDEVAELFHTGGIAGKGNHDKIGSNLSVCFYIMKFVRFMKDDLPLLQGQFSSPAVTVTSPLSTQRNSQKSWDSPVK